MQDDHPESFWGDHAIGYRWVSQTISVIIHLSTVADHVDVTGILITLPDIE